MRVRGGGELFANVAATAGALGGVGAGETDALASDDFEAEVGVDDVAGFGGVA